MTLSDGPPVFPPEGTPWRGCVWPGCRRRFDVVAMFSGEAEAPGWLQSSALGLVYLCPEHADLGHLPQRRGLRPACPCGFVGHDGVTSGALLAQWLHHLTQPSREGKTTTGNLTNIQ